MVTTIIDQHVDSSGMKPGNLLGRGFDTLLVVRVQLNHLSPIQNVNVNPESFNNHRVK